MKNIKKEKREKEIYESESGFEFVRESQSHSLYESTPNVGDLGVEDPEKSPSLQQTGGGQTAKEEKIVTPDGTEVDSLYDMFKWIDDNYPEKKDNSFSDVDSEEVELGGEFTIKTEDDFNQVFDEEYETKKKGV